MNTNIDMSPELILHRHHNGVQLRRPSYGSTDLNLGDILKKRISVFFKNKNHIMLNANNHQLECIHASSLKDIIGKKFIDIIDDNAVNRMIEKNNNEVMNTQRITFFNESIDAQNITTKAISVKMPLYDLNNQVLGVFGFSYLTETDCAPSNPVEFSDTVNLFFESNQTNTSNQTFLDTSLPYSPREIDLIHLILRGKTMQEAAPIMNISTRTAEHYFSNIKHKAHAKTRSALIDVLLKQGFKIA
jgi:DNA-binding CsgD family transcriptional regulator